jgi:hypothetical protein
MKKTFTCPHCHAVLNPSVKVLLVVKYKRKQGLILLSPQPGNYKFICDPSVCAVMDEGSMITFYCPVCSADLTSPANKKFVELNLVDPNGGIRKVQFSRVHGTHATFIVDGEEIIPYGENVEDFGPTNFFGS